MPSVLVVDDDTELCQLLSEYLATEGYVVETVHTGLRGVERALEGDHAIVVLDVMLPDLKGFEVLRRVRAQSRRPILMLTARGDEPDKVAGLDAGADDYITKPFSTQELLARIRAVLRRRAPEQGGDSMKIGELSLDPATHRVSWQGKPLKVGPTEFKLLNYLMKCPERVHSRSQLLDKVWGDHVFIEERTVDVHVKRLRESLGPAASLVETVRGAGYRLTSQVASPASS
jgi:two-component system phosphate regulon response regulator PhoB